MSYVLNENKSPLSKELDPDLINSQFSTISYLKRDFCNSNSDSTLSKRPHLLKKPSFNLKDKYSPIKLDSSECGSPIKPKIFAVKEPANFTKEFIPTKKFHEFENKSISSIEKKKKDGLILQKKASLINLHTKKGKEFYPQTSNTSNGKQDQFSHPNCLCGKPSVLSKVLNEKSGNFGKKFFKCAETDLKKKCLYSMWLSDMSYKKETKKVVAPPQQRINQSPVSNTSAAMKGFRPANMTSNVSRPFSTVMENIPKKNYGDEPELSAEQREILNIIIHKKRNVFFTGSAGTGKSFLLRRSIEMLRSQYKNFEIAITAPTGIAACNINGQTLHSFAGLGISNGPVLSLVSIIRKSRRTLNRWQQLKVLIIDEVSMVDPEYFDKLEEIARIVRSCDLPFGGIQIILCGDFMQLPPVKQSAFCFEAKCWKKVVHNTFELRHIYRQTEPRLIRLLSEMRRGNLSVESLSLLQSLERPIGEAPKLFSRRDQVLEANRRYMERLNTESRIYKAKDKGIEIFVKKLNDCLIVPDVLELKINCRVMYCKNSSTNSKLVNGSLGTVARFSSESGNPVVNYDGIGEHEVEFDMFTIEGSGGEQLAQRWMIPLTLAYAMTIHKSQGQTLQKVVVDLSKAFECGQAYVAISRCTCLEGLRVIGFTPDKLKFSQRAVEFHKQLQSAIRT